jgi:hypothetical protein
MTKKSRMGTRKAEEKVQLRKVKRAKRVEKK